MLLFVIQKFVNNNGKQIAFGEQQELIIHTEVFVEQL
jgi:hypothetical protein